MIEVQAAIAHGVALHEAWVAELSGIDLTWLPLEFFP